MALIAHHSWNPGLTSTDPNSAGTGIVTKAVFDAWRQEGHDIAVLQHRDVPDTVVVKDLRDVDVLFLSWRWEMPEYPHRQYLYESQWQYILEAEGYGIPIIVHDLDHKISGPDMLKLCMLDTEVVLTAPEWFPRPGFRQLMFPFPWTGDPTWLRGQWIPPVLSYVGNNYERYGQAVRHFNAFAAAGWAVLVWGNWTEAGKDGRMPPERVFSDMPKVSFLGRLGQEEVVPKLSMSVATLMLAKPSYCMSGLMAVRWAEAAQAGALCLTPKEFRVPERLPPGLHLGDDIVSHALSLRYMTDDRLTDLRSAQYDFVRKYARIEPWLDIIREVMT